MVWTMGNVPAPVFLGVLRLPQYPAVPSAGVSARRWAEGADGFLVPAVAEVIAGGDEDEQDGQDDQGLILRGLVLVVSGLTVGELPGNQGASHVQEVVERLEEREHQQGGGNHQDGEIFEPKFPASFVPVGQLLFLVSVYRLRHALPQ